MFSMIVLHDFYLCVLPEVQRSLVLDALGNMTYAPSMVSTGTPALFSPLHSSDGLVASYVRASYYPSWSADALPAHAIDFLKFDVLSFGGQCF